MSKETKETKETKELKIEEKKAEAFIFAGGETNLEKNSDESKTAKIRMLARSSKPIEHWAWGRVVHDMQGMKLNKKKIPVDYAHEFPIGYLNQFMVKPDGLWVSGVIKKNEARSPDYAAIVMNDMNDDDIPYEASINFGGDGIRAERIFEGETANVNGYELEGPATIIREWPLRSVAICQHGADMNTSSELFSAKNSKNNVGKNIKFEYIYNGENNMSQETKNAEVELEETTSEDSKEFVEEEVVESNETVEADVEDDNKEFKEEVEEVEEEKEEGDEKEEEEKEEEEKEVEEKEVEEKEVEEKEVEEKIETEQNQETEPNGKKFLDEFGTQGAVWFAEGKSYDEASALFVEALKAENKQLKEKLEEYKELRGEKEPLSFESADKKVENISLVEGFNKLKQKVQ